MDEVPVTNFNDMPRKAVGDALVTNGFRTFHNFAATDAQLAQEVLSELALRKADLKEPTRTTSCSSPNGTPSMRACCR